LWARVNIDKWTIVGVSKKAGLSASLMKALASANSHHIGKTMHEVRLNND